jgi:filamentous hemagglutinin family protein
MTTKHSRGNLTGKGISDPAAARFRLNAIAAAVMLAFAPAAHAARPGDILPAGVLPSFKGATFGNITPPSVTGNPMTIQQQSQKVILEWNSFNIGRNATVEFKQPNSGASALNRIFDQDPSIIQGRLIANGQVYLINQNGILFDRGAQIDVHTLIGSTLNITDEVYKRAFDATQPLQFTGLKGYTAIDIGLHGPADAGAPVLKARPGGSIVLLAPQIHNNGIIRADDGQVILAAGSSVILSQADATDNDYSMRGLLVQVTADSGPLNLTSLVSNLGTIGSDRGNTTIAALAVNQAGRISAKTAVNKNGSIWIVGRDVTTTAGSRIETPLDTASSTRLADDQSYDPYRAEIKVSARSLVHAGSMTAEGGRVWLHADWNGGTAVTASNSAKTSRLQLSGAEPPGGPRNDRIYLEAGSTVSAAGAWADLPMSKNELTVKLTSNDLKDAPFQKGGTLLQQTVTLDLRKPDSPLFDASGYRGAVQRGVEEKASAGGEVQLLSSGDVIVRQGAVVDVSGGGYRFAPGTVNTTKLLSGGRVVDIHDASADARYDTVVNTKLTVTDKHWGVTREFAPLIASLAPVEAGYVQGSAGGSLLVSAPGGIVLDGSLRSGAYAGRYQLEQNKAPSPGSITIGTAPVNTSNRSLAFDAQVANVTFQEPGVRLAPSFGQNDDLQQSIVDLLPLTPTLWQAPTLTGGTWHQGGFGEVTVYANGQIKVPNPLSGPANGKLQLTASDVTISAPIVAPGGSVLVDARPTVQPHDASQDVLITGAGAIQTKGNWVNQSGSALANNGTGFLTPASTGGGSIALLGQNVFLEKGTRLDVSGGGVLQRNGSIAAGDAGSITLAVGTVSNSDPQKLRLDGTLAGYALGKGGRLEIDADSFIVGADGTGKTIGLDTSFLHGNGFAQYTFVADTTFTLAAGRTVELYSTPLQLRSGAALSAPSGTDLLTISEPVSDPQLRKSASVTVTAPSIAIESKSAILGDPGTAIKLAATDTLDIDGTLRAPAGSIALSLKPSGGGLFPGGALHLGANGQLLAPGAFIEKVQPNPLLTLGEVARAGSITVDVSRNYFVTDAGSLIDVSGTSHAVSIATGQGAGAGFVTRNIGGDAGVLSITSTESVRLNGKIDAAAGAPGSAGGTFALQLNKRNDPALPEPTPAIVVANQPNLGATNGPQQADAGVSPQTLRASGFDRLRLRSAGRIDFQGSTALDFAREVRLDAPEIRSQPGARVTIDTAQGWIGDSNVGVSAPLLPNAFVPALASGNGTLAMRTGQLDVYGHFVMNGFSDVSLASRGDTRFVGRPLRQVSSTAIEGNVDELSGSLRTNAKLHFTAAQLYPTSATRYVVQSGPDVATPGAGAIDIARSGNPPGLVLSAGGSLTLRASRIESAGVVRAPLGTLSFDAADSIALTAGSLTSVSLDGRTVPFGGTLNGLNWIYGKLDPLQTVPDKSIVMKAPAVTVSRGAAVDLSGGGDIVATEFVAGIQGSRDFLLGKDTYAILPGLAGAGSPYDAHLLGLKDLGFANDSGLYNAVELSGGGGLAAGVYPLLPGYYGLLPGAYVIQAAGASYRDLQAGAIASLANGTPVVAGRLAVAGTGLRDPRTSGFAVIPGSQIGRYAEYRTTTAQFFADKAQLVDAAIPALPRDGGRLSLLAGRTLDLSGDLVSSALPDARLAQVDFAAPSIAIVSSSTRGTSGAGVLELDAAQLSRPGLSVLVGGTRSGNGDTTEVTVTARSVRVNNDSADPLTVPEVILAATNDIAVTGSSVIDARGTAPARSSDLKIAGTNATDGAVLRLSAAAQAGLDRNGTPPGAAGNITIDAGAKLSAARSIRLDATGNAVSRGTLSLPTQTGELALGAGTIALGDGATTAAGALALGGSDLLALADLGRLDLHAYRSLDFYGSGSGGTTALGGEKLGRVTIDAPVIRGVTWLPANGSTAVQPAAAVTATSIALVNTGAAGTDSSIGAAGSSLVLSGDDVQLGAGSKRITGFSDVQLHSRGEVRGTANGDLSTSGNLAIAAARVTPSSGVHQTIRAGLTDDAATTLSMTRIADPLGTLSPLSAGGWLTLLGGAVHADGNIVARSGRIDLVSLRQGGQTFLDQHAIVDASGYSGSIGAARVVADAGSILLKSTSGDVVTAQGSLIDVSGASGGGAAGSLQLDAAAGTVTLGGTQRGTAAGGQRTGAVAIDAGHLDSPDALLASLSQGGFRESVDLRLRSGNLNVTGAQARHIRLQSDAGSIVVAGTLDASSATGGGSVELYAQDDIRLVAGSFIDARGLSASREATAPYSNGGNVVLETRTGTVSFDTGAKIDVSANANGKSHGGSVEVIVPRTAAGTDVKANLDGEIRVGGATAAGDSSGSVVLEGRKSYGAADGVTGDISGFGVADSSNVVWSDYAAFMQAADVIKGRMHVAGLPADRLHVRAGIELNGSDDLALTQGWDLTADPWNLNGEPGRLSIRSTGSIVLSDYIGLPDFRSEDGAPYIPPSVATWNLRVVAGADVNAANPMATRSVASGSEGALTLQKAPDEFQTDPRVKVGAVRTGTGNIQIASAGDLSLTDRGAAIYTTGRTTEETGTDGVYATDGGNVTIASGGNASGVRERAWINDWLRRTDTRSGAQPIDGAGWWTARSFFDYGIGTFGGGNVTLQAAGDINELSAVTVSNAKVSPGPVLTVQGGGDLNVSAGGSIAGGEYLVSNGNGRIRASADIGAAQPTALYLIGESGDPARRGVTMSAQAGGKLELQNVSNPTAMTQSTVTQDFFGLFHTSFLSYSPQSRLDAIAFGGDLVLGDKPTLKPSVAAPSVNLPLAGGNIYPAVVNAVALDGNVRGTYDARKSGATNGVLLAPASDARIQLAAAKDVSALRVEMIDVPDTVFPSWRNPVRTVGENAPAYLVGALAPTRSIEPSAFDGTFVDQIVAGGNIIDTAFVFPQRSLISAGGDIRSPRLELQNVSASDVSVVEAGRDIRLTTTSSAGVPFVEQRSIRIGGPGNLVVRAGRNIDLADSEGIRAGGNSFNNSLPAGSADVVVMAGVTQPVALAGVHTLFDTLLDAGKKQDAKAADDGIRALFNNTNTSPGDIALFLSSIRTEGGSDIDILVPRGNVDVGLPAPAQGKDLGIVTTSGGAIRAFASGNFNINQSKIVSLRGGDVLIYSSEGNIDAGRGARDSRVSQPPRRVPVFATDENGKRINTGQFQFTPPADGVGSGIRTMTSEVVNPDGTFVTPRAGDVFLFAPRGFVDAGEAGVVSGGSIFVAALQVINAANFSASGASVGVPSGATASVAASLSGATSAAAGASKSAEDVSRQQSNTRPDDSKRFIPSFLSVEVLGFGEESAER